MTHSGLLVRDLVVGYGRRKPVIDSAELSIEPGRLVSLLGMNGSGKSTFLHALLGLVPARQGTVELLGEPMRRIQRHHVGFCADDLPLPTLLTGREFLLFSATARELVLTTSDVESLFASVRMRGAERRMIREYSHGMARKLMLIANVLHEPALLILDEPFRGLDPEAHALMLRIMQSLVADGGIVLVSTHDLAVAARVSDDIIVMDQGRIRSLDEFDRADADAGVDVLAHGFERIVARDERPGSAEDLFEILARLRTRR